MSRSILGNITRVYPVTDTEILMDLCGQQHANLALLEDEFSISAESVLGGIKLTGEDAQVTAAEQALAGFESRIKNGTARNMDELRGAIVASVTDNDTTTGPAIKGLRATISARTEGQKHYLKTITNPSNALVFGVGPAGTGKTFLAVAQGAAELVKGTREKLIVTRPAVEAGEKLGFLPGTLEDKVDPYMLPIWDALRELVGKDRMDRYLSRGQIEVAPLAFMRGRTLKKAFVVVDEAQNTTTMQMKMLLTRFGRDSRMVVTGDPGQVDLPRGVTSGLGHALDILKPVEGIHICRMTAKDVVRHPLVGKIIDAYAGDKNKA